MASTHGLTRRRRGYKPLSGEKPCRGDGPGVRIQALWEKTALLPSVVADTVLNEVEAFLNQDLPKEWSKRLEEKANTVWEHNRTWRRKMLRASGNSGRDMLYMFMRHWLAGIMQKEQPALYKRMPKSYSMGEKPPLPK